MNRGYSLSVIVLFLPHTWGSNFTRKLCVT